MEIKIIFESSDFLVIDKPAGIIVHPTKYQKQDTLIQVLLKKYPFLSSIGEAFRPGIVHRLDKLVSGLMVLAKTQSFYNHLISEFKNKKVKEEYIGLVYGQVQRDKGIIDLPIGWTKKGKIVARDINLKSKKPAQTKYSVLKRYKDFTLLKIEPLTGRTHQIRAHLSAIGHPLVGDKDYKFKDQPLLCQRIFLHCNYLGFFDLKGKFREFISPLPDDLNNLLETLNEK